MQSAQWGQSGRIVSLPSITASSTTRSAGTVSSTRHLFDPIDINWTDNAGQQQTERLLDIRYSSDATDPASYFNWQSSSNTLSFSATRNSLFTIDASSSWLDSAAQGTLTLQYQQGIGYSLNGTGRFAGATGALNAASGQFEMSLGGIALTYNAPVATYGLSFGAAGETDHIAAVPEPSQYVLLSAGGVLLLLMHRQRRSKKDVS